MKGFVLPLAFALASFFAVGVTLFFTIRESRMMSFMRPRMMICLLSLDFTYSLCAIGLFAACVHSSTSFYDFMRFTPAMQVWCYLLYFLQNLSIVWTGVIIFHGVYVNMYTIAANSPQELARERVYYIIFCCFGVVMVPSYWYSFYSKGMGLFYTTDSLVLGRIQTTCIICVSDADLVKTIVTIVMTCLS